MVTNPDLVQSFEHHLIGRTPPDYLANLRIMEALCQEAGLLKVWPPSDPLAGIDVDIRLARALTVHRSP